MSRRPADLPEIRRLLGQLLADLGLSEDLLHDEKVATLGLQESVTVDGERAPQIAATLRRLRELCGDALTAAFRIGGLPRKLSDEISDDDVRRLAAASPLTFDLTLKKETLLDLWGARSKPNTECRCFVEPQALAAALGPSLEEFESNFLGEETEGRKVLVLAAGPDLALDGEHFSLVAGERLGSWERFLPGAAPDQAPDQAPLRAMRERALGSLRWVNVRLERLTPLHLPSTLRKAAADGAAEAPGAPAGEAALALRARLLDAVLLYSAGETRVRRDVTPALWTARFGGERHEAEVRFQQPRVLAVAGEDGDSGPAIVKLAELLTWAYGTATEIADPIPILQSVIADRLEGNAPEANYAAVVRLADEIDRHARWAWDSLIKRKLERYFERIKELTELLEATRDRYNEQVERLTKALSDNVLAAVAVVIGSFIAAVFDDDFNPTVFRLGVGIYAGYLLVFPGILGLLAARSQYRYVRSTYRRQRRFFLDHLDPAAVAGVLGDPASGDEAERAGRRYDTWYWATATVYVLVIALLLAAAVCVPCLVS